MCDAYAITDALSFHPFNRLPIELRLQVWDMYHHLTPPRIISLQVASPDRQLDQCDQWPHIFYNPHAIPTILHITHESREVGLRFYQLGFEVSQDLRTIGSWWGERQHADYRKCVHEYIAARRQNEKGNYLYWDKDRDVVDVNMDTNTDRDQMWNRACYRTATSIWSGQCNIEFEVTPWLCVSLAIFRKWTEDARASKICHRSSIFTGMKVIFVFLDDEAKQEREDGWASGESFEACLQQWGTAWVGAKVTLAPEVRAVESAKQVLDDIQARL